MKLTDLGYSTDLEKYRLENAYDSFDVGRVITAHKDRYIVKTAESEYEAELLGNLRFTVSSKSELPVVGDWVAIQQYDVDKALIHAVFPRKGVIQRQAVGAKGEKQLIAANIDTAFIAQAVDRDFSINRIERYLTICNTASVKAVIILTKIDLINSDQLEEIITGIKTRISTIPIYSISNLSQEGIQRIAAYLQKSKTYCLLGSSGVGKSSLLNSLCEKRMMKTEHISEHSNRGRHITTHRELIVLENGALLIDNPGMREVGMTDTAVGLEKTFEQILVLSNQCQFKDCTHTVEKGCAIIEAVVKGTIDTASYENYLRMQREQAHYETTVAEKRKKEKVFGKLMKQYKKDKKYGKY